jgi:hypothetical protein
MKEIFQIITLGILSFHTIQVKAQEKFANYESSYFSKVYDIQISLKENDDFSLWFDAFSFDKLHKDGGVKIKKDNYQNFTTAMQEAKIKYEEWLKTAKENNIKELTKNMTMSSLCDGYFLYGTKWNFQFDVKLRFEFRILESNGIVKNLLLVKTGELKSSSNEFMTVDGFVLVFSSTKEIDDFISVISIEKISAFQNKPKKEELFKD